MNNKDKHDSALSLSPRTRKYFHSRFFYRGQICRFEGLSIMSTDEISNIVALELLSPHLSLVSSSNVIIKFYYQIEKKQRVRNVRREKYFKKCFEKMFCPNVCALFCKTKNTMTF